MKLRSCFCHLFFPSFSQILVRVSFFLNSYCSHATQVTFVTLLK